MRGWWGRLVARVRDGTSVRAWAVDANDGIIATAGILEGFAGAGASDRLLWTAAAIATLAGALGVGGAKWAEAAAEREAQVVTAAREQAELTADPDAELAELVAYYEAKGLSPRLAREVAEELSARDALAAQLESEHGIDELMPPTAPIWTGVAAALAFGAGALVPLVLSLIAPVSIEAWAILAVVVVSLAVTSIVVARSGGMSVPRMLMRTVSVGVATLGASYLAGALLF